MTTPNVTSIVPGQGMADSVTAPIPATPPAQYFTADQMSAARQQEKDKLYDQLKKNSDQLAQFKSTLDQLQTEKETRDSELTAQKQAADDAKKKADDAKLSTQELLAKKEAEFNALQEKLNKDFELKMTILQKDQALMATKAYAQRRVAEEVAANTIIPDLVEYIDGDTESEIEASIAKAKEKTASIVQGATSLGTPVVPGGVSPTGGPSGPFDALSGPRQPTTEEIAAMNNTQYREWREKSGMARAGQGVGIMGI